MAKHKPIRRHRSIIYVLAAVIILVLLFFAVGGPNKARRIYYSNLTHYAFDHELSTLKQPLNTLGIQTASPKWPQCSVQAYYLYDTPQLQCVMSAKNYVVIGNSAARKAQFNQAAKQLDADFKTDGWTFQSNATPSISAWFQGMTSGKDYFPGAGGYKIWGNKHCDIQIGEAYSNPKPPAFSIELECGAPVLQKLRDEGV